MKKTVFAVLLSLISFSVFAQAPQPKTPTPAPRSAAPRAKVTADTVTLTWLKSTTPSTSYNLYRAPCTGTFTQGTGTTGVGTCSQPGTFADIAPGLTVLTYTDSSVAASQVYVYQVTSLCTTASGTACSPVGSESGPSNQIAAQIPTPVVPPAPPGTLSIPSITEKITGSNETITASWSDAPNSIDAYNLFTAQKTLKSGVLKFSPFAITWSGPIQAPGTGLFLAVCNVRGDCRLKAA